MKTDPKYLVLLGVTLYSINTLVRTSQFVSSYSSSVFAFHDDAAVHGNTSNTITDAAKEAFEEASNVVDSQEPTKVEATKENDIDTNADADSGTANGSKSCLSNVSQAWLEADRYGNIPLNNSHSSFPLEGPLLGHENLKVILGQQNLCQNNCRFRALDNDAKGEGGYDNPSEELVHTWKIRLIYAAIYHHQHRHAIQEARERQQIQALQGEGECKKDMKKYDVGTFDYECKDAKFLVSPVRTVGIGSFLIEDWTNLIMSAIVFDRTLVLYNNVTINGTQFEAPWGHATCGRGDFQCHFQPVTACSPAIDSIANANATSFFAFRGVLLNPRAAIPYGDAKFIKFDHKRGLPTAQRILKAVHNIVSTLIDELDPNDRRLPTMKKAASAILVEPRDNHVSDFIHAAMMYALRPNVARGEQLEAFYQNDMPDDFDSKRTLGMPIRGSDKCNQESECLKPSTYIKLMGSIWTEHGLSEKFGDGKANVLVTSELPDIMERVNEVSANDTMAKQLPFTPRWITNTNDVRPGNGNVFRANLSHGQTRDDVMTSILSSFKLQMSSLRTIGNCCSNFHRVIFHLLRGGCGIEPENKGICLQSRNESIYQLCCNRRSSPVCPRLRLGRIAVEFNDTNITLQEAENRLWDLP